MKSFLAVVILLTMSCFANGQCVGSSGFYGGCPSSGFYGTKSYRTSYVNPYAWQKYNRPYVPSYGRPFQPSYGRPYQPSYGRPYQPNYGLSLIHI